MDIEILKQKVISIFKKNGCQTVDIDNKRTRIFLDLTNNKNGETKKEFLYSWVGELRIINYKLNIGFNKLFDDGSVKLKNYIATTGLEFLALTSYLVTEDNLEYLKENAINIVKASKSVYSEYNNKKTIKRIKKEKKI